MHQEFIEYIKEKDQCPISTTITKEVLTKRQLILSHGKRAKIQAEELTKSMFQIGQKIKKIFEAKKEKSVGSEFEIIEICDMNIEALKDKYEGNVGEVENDRYLMYMYVDILIEKITEIEKAQLII